MKKFPPRSVFISYNHDESCNIAGRIYERLASRLTPAAVFKDDEDATRRLGFDFRTTFEAALKDCRVVLVVIDPSWYERRMLSEKQGDDMPPDWVRIEVESALNTPGLAVIPLMVDGADFPKNKPLPTTITDLRYRDGKRIPSDEGFGPSMDDLVRHLEAQLGVKPSARPVRPSMPLVALFSAAILLCLVTWGLWKMTYKPAALADARNFADGKSKLGSSESKKNSEAGEIIKSNAFSIRFLTVDGDEITPSTRVKATAHRVFAPEYGMSMYLLIDNQGQEISGPLSAEFYLSEKLRPNRSVAYGSSIENDKTGLTWKWSVGIWPSRLDKGQAAKARGYTLITPFCPIDESTPMGPDLPVAFRILGPDGKILAETRFLVNVQPELIPKQRMEYQTLDAQESPAGWYLDGQPGGAAQLRLGDAALMYPLSLTWLQKYKNVGLPTDKPITTVVLLPEALKPPKRSNIRRLEWGEKAGLPWAWWTSWLIGPQTEFRVGAGMIEIDEELLDGFEAGYYHFRVLNLLAADVPVFLEGKLQKPALFDKYYTVFIPKPEPVYPRPSSPVLEIVAPAPTGWPSVRAVAFKKSTIHPTASYAVAMPLRFKNIGERAIDISTLSALLYLPDGTVIDDKLLVGPSGALPMLKKVEKNCYPFADTSFTLVTGPWVGIGSGQLPPGEETTLNTGFYLGMPDSLPDAAKSIDSKIIGVKILQMATNGSGEDILLYTGVINLNLEWHENWSESEHNALLKR